MPRSSVPTEGWSSSGDSHGWSAPTEHGGWPAASPDDGWGPSTAVYSGNGSTSTVAPDSPPPDPAPTRVGRAYTPAPDDWIPAGPLSAREQRATRAVERRAEPRYDAHDELDAQPRPPERGLPWWGALLILVGLAGASGLLDEVASIKNSGAFNVGIVVASIIAVLVVRRSQMFPIVIAPPIVYSAAALSRLYVRSSGLHDRKVILDSAANYLVYGFPAIACATAAVLIIAGIRLITRK